MTKEVELNVKEAVLAPIIHLMQGDSGVSIRCRIMSGADAYAVGGMFDLVVLSGVTSKGHMLSLPVNSVSGNLVEFELTQNETDVAGDIRACIEFSGSEGTKPRRLSTYPFIIKVTENPSYTAVGQKDNVKSLEDYVEQMKGYADMAGNASEIIKDAKREAEECASAARGFSETAGGHAEIAGEYAEHASDAAENVSRDVQEIRGLIADAQGSAERASASAQTATKKADMAEISAASAVEGSENARKYAEQAKLISESFSGALRPMGTVVYESLPSLQDAVEGDMYNISNEFSTSSSFKEGEGNVIPAGANIYKTVDGFWDVLAGSPVTSVNGQRGNVDITPENIGAVSKEDLDELKKSVSDGKSSVASAITALGVPTASDAAFDDMAGNIKDIIAGDALAPNVLSGKTFSSENAGRDASGTMPNQTNVRKVLTGSNNNAENGGYSISGTVMRVCPATGYHDYTNTLWENCMQIEVGNALASDVLDGKRFTSSAGRNVSGTLADLRSAGAVFIGSHFSPGGTFQFALISVDNVCCAKFDLHYTINTSNLGTISEYADWGCPHVVVSGGGGTINILRSSWSIDATNYQKMVVQLYGTTKYVGGGMCLRGCVGVCAKGATSSTGAEGRDYALRYGEYQFNTFDEHWKDVVVDLSGISQEVVFHMSTVHAGDVYVRTISFVPN